MKLSRKVIVLSSVLAVMILGGVILCAQLVKTAARNNITEMEYQRLVKQDELAGELCGFDKVEKAHVWIAVSDNEISSVKIHLETIGEISDLDIGNITLFVSERLEALEENIDIHYTVS